MLIVERSIENMLRLKKNNCQKLDEDISLHKVKVGNSFIVKEVIGKDKTKAFLFTLGCFKGEKITLISILADNYIINIKDSRYAIDKKMAKTIILEK